MNMTKMISIVSIFAAIAVQASPALARGPLVSGGGEAPAIAKVAGQGGMAECLALSMSAALEVHAQNNPMTPMPVVVVEQSHGSPSNGIDIQVTVNHQIIYYVIASPNLKIVNGKPQGLLGCTDARVTSRVLVQAP